jgi:hypothetical protein
VTPVARDLPLTVLPDRYALCQLPATTAIPAWAVAPSPFVSISRTPTELSIVTVERAVPDELPAERGYRVLKVRGPLPLDLIGVFVAIGAPLAEAGISIFPIATYETDYVLVRETDLDRAVEALRGAGHVI